MGAKASTPQHGRRLRVIGPGLSRTGTASFTAALEILLDGPIYHGGTQNTIGPEPNIKTWIEILKHSSTVPYKSSADREIVLKGLRSIHDGFVAETDAPGYMYVEELLELHPDAKVVCTVRDREAWKKSMDLIAKTALSPSLKWFLWPLPTLRYFTTYIDLVQFGRSRAMYGPKTLNWDEMWTRHMEYLKRVVPEDKLLFYDLKEGWEPLCKFLEVDVPKDVDLPRINDSKAMEEFSKRQVMRGVVAWLKIFAGSAVVVAGALYWAW